MKNSIIESNLKTLKKSYLILELLSDEQYSNCSIAPYYSSIGSHLRHTLDFYNCILFPNGEDVDLTNRRRDVKVEISRTYASDYLSIILFELEKFDLQMDSIVFVLDDLGNGEIKMPYTYSALLSQANSHAIHHYAIINYILEGLNINIQDDTFGFNPTTINNV